VGRSSCSTDLPLNRLQATFCGPRDGRFPVAKNIRTPPRAVDLFELIRFDPLKNAMDRGSSERDEIRVTPHETDVTAIRDDLNNVAGKQRAFAIRAGRPVQHRAAFEMSATTNQPDFIPERESVSLPKFQARAVTHCPLSILRV